MIKETGYERLKNSRGEVSLPRHYIMDSASELELLPPDAPVGSDAFAKGGKAFMRFPSGWAEV